MSNIGTITAAQERAVILLNELADIINTVAYVDTHGDTPVEHDDDSMRVVWEVGGWMTELIVWGDGTLNILTDCETSAGPGVTGNIVMDQEFLRGIVVEFAEQSLRHLRNGGPVPSRTSTLYL